jgi:NAD(P)H dehydrogenase (quinone)
MTNPILVTGASGQLGRRILHHLLESNGVQPSGIIATTRNPDGLAQFAARGVVVRRADFDDAASLEQAFAGAKKILIISTDLFDLVDGKRLKQHETAIEAARKAGATHAAYTSMLYPEPGSPIPFASDHFGTEQALKASGLSYTIFQNNAYHENLFMSLPAILASGRWFTSAGQGRTAYVARDDIAAAIASRLASKWDDSATLALTGTKAYSNAEVAGLTTEVTGRHIEVVDFSDEALAEHLKAAGVPDPFVSLMVAVDVNARAGYADLENDLVAKLTRREPVSLKSFLEASKSALVA